MRLRRAGLTLVEVVIAILVFSAGALGLAASSALVAREMKASVLRSRAASVARNRSEAAHATACASVSAGEDTRDGIRSVWRVAPGSVATLDQDVERASGSVTKSDRFLSALRCD